MRVKMNEPIRDEKGTQAIITSLCPKCLKVIPGIVRENEGAVVMDKTCPDHGPFRTLVSTDLSRYAKLGASPRKVTKSIMPRSRVDKGCPHDCGLCSSHDQHTCLAILEIVSYCDLQCPVCLADSKPRGKFIGISTLKSALKSLVSCEGDVTPIQIGGGEPTLHPDLPSVIREMCWLGFNKIELDSNGLALARDPSLSERLREVGLSSVYLQMDSLSPEISIFIRGRDLVQEKLRAIENCKKAGLEVILSVTVVPDVNDGKLWEMIQFGVEQGLTGVNFQAIALSGRFPEYLRNSSKRFTAGHFIQAVAKQSDKRLRENDFMPIPCPDPRCGLMSYMLIHKGDLIPLNRVMPENHLVDLVADQSDWDIVMQQIHSNTSNGCDCKRSWEKTSGLESLCLDLDYFSVGFHGMMDAYSFDRERARKCCVHELTWDGRLIPFCLYNIKYRHHHYLFR
jgi:7,8-dihydro-6-hydroxymethylpterin dimethyltransferase